MVTRWVNGCKDLGSCHHPDLSLGISISWLVAAVCSLLQFAKQREAPVSGWQLQLRYQPGRHHVTSPHTLIPPPKTFHHWQFRRYDQPCMPKGNDLRASWWFLWYRIELFWNRSMPAVRVMASLQPNSGWMFMSGEPVISEPTFTVTSGPSAVKYAWHYRLDL